MRYYKTSEIAKAFGLHPNTIRLYEKWGLLPKIPRTPSGYRLYTRVHMDHVKLIRLAMKCTMFGREIKHTAYEVITVSAGGDYRQALERAERLRVLLENEYRQAEEAERFLEEWGSRRNASGSGRGQPVPEPAQETVSPAPVSSAAEIPNAPMSRNEAAKLLDITPDMLRDWERNGLITIPRDPGNGYRMYGTDEINKLRVIRVLRRSNYSNMAILRAVQKLESGSAQGLKELLDSPEIDEERGYLCFTDTLLTSLRTALDAVHEIIRLLQTIIRQYDCPDD
jgi:DNA-binding transcriptional MerR regulator